MAEYPTKGCPGGLGLGIAGLMLQLGNSVPNTEESLAALFYSSQERGPYSWGSALTAKESSYPKKLDKSGYEDWKRQWEKKTSGYEDWKRRWEARLNKKSASSEKFGKINPC